MSDNTTFLHGIAEVFKHPPQQPARPNDSPFTGIGTLLVCLGAPVLLVVAIQYGRPFFRALSLLLP